MSLKNYYLNSNNYKVIYHKKYKVKVYRPQIGTVVHNIFTGEEDKTSTYKPFIIVGPLGDEHVVSKNELINDYETTGGDSPLESLNMMTVSSSLDLIYKNIDKKYYVTMVPYKLMNVKIHGLTFNRDVVYLTGHEQICQDYVEACYDVSKRQSFLNKYSGNLKSGYGQDGILLYQYIIPHGMGDYVVCESLPDGKSPDFKTVSCVNGSLFEQYFDMRYVSSISIHLFSILLEVEMRRVSNDGYNLNSSGELLSMSYEFVDDENLSNVHNIYYKILLNGKLGKLYASLDKTKEDINVSLECLGNRVNLISYKDYKNKYISLCQKRGTKQINDLELLIYYVELILNDACNFIQGAVLQVSKEAEQIAEFVVQEVKKMFTTLGQGRISLDRDITKQGYRIYTVTYQHDLYGIESKSGIKFKLIDCTVEACIFDTNTKREVPLVNKIRIQNRNNLNDFISSYRSNLIQVVSGAAFK